MYGGGYKSLSKSLIRTKLNYNLILIGITLSLFAMQCSKSGTTDPVATTPGTQSACQSGQTKQADGSCLGECVSGTTLQADGTCKSPDGTITCKVGETKNASGQCVAITCTSVQTLNQSGICVTKACPTGQTLNTSNGQCEVQCVGAINGPTKFIWKYLDKTNPSPTSTNSANASLGIVMAKGCMETNTGIEWQSAQRIINQTSFLELLDGGTSVKIASLNFTNNSLDSFAYILPTLSLYAIIFSPQNRTGSDIFDGLRRAFSYTFYISAIIQSPLSSCFNSNCFVKLENNIFIRSFSNVLSNDFSNFTTADLNDPTKFDPSIKAEINRMYTNFANTPGVTWKTIPTWHTVIIP